MQFKIKQNKSKGSSGISFVFLILILIGILMLGSILSSSPVIAQSCPTGCKEFSCGGCAKDCSPNGNTETGCAAEGESYSYCQSCKSHDDGTCSGGGSVSSICGGNGGPDDDPGGCTETACNPPVPANSYVCYGGNAGMDNGSCYKLSKNAANPTIIRAPDPGERFYVKYSKVYAQATCASNGIEYLLRLDTYPNHTNMYISPAWTDEHFTPNMRAESTWSAGKVYEFWGGVSSKNVCDSGRKVDLSYPQPHGYFKINSVPRVISVSPNSGLSGTATDADNGAACVDNNSRDFTVTYRDPDGVAQIHTAGFWIDDAAPYAAGNSAHLLISKGAWVKIDAKGICQNGCPDMRVTAAGTVIGNVAVGSVRDSYYFHSNVPIAAKDITISYTNDDASSPNRSLQIYGIYLGVSKETGRVYPQNATLSTAGESYTPGAANNELIGSTTFQVYGLSGNDWLADPNGSAPGATYQFCGNSLSPRADSIFPACTDPSTYVAVTSITQAANGLDLVVTYKVEFVKDIGSSLTQYGVVLDSYGFDKPITGEWGSIGSYTLDLTPPNPTTSGFIINNQNTASINWSIAEANGLNSTYGEVRLTGSTYPIGTKQVIDTTSGITVSLPGQFATNTGYVTPYIWNLSGGAIPVRGANLWGRLETFNLSDLNEGRFNLQIHAVDNACNTGVGVSGAGSGGSSSGVLEIGKPWFATKGGFVYSGGNIIDPVQDVEDAPGGHFSLPYPSNPWTIPFQILNNEANVSTSLLLTGGLQNSAINRTGSTFNPYSITTYNYPSLFSHSLSSYEWMKQSANKVTFYNIQRLNSVPGNTLTGNISSICNDPSKDSCAIFSSASLVINNLVCDKKTLIMSDGTITVSPEVKLDGTARHGCIFVAANDITIAAGAYKSQGKTTPESEYLNGYFIAGSQITIADVDAGRDITDILKINGGLIAFGEDGSGTSLNWNRSLRLKENQTYPTFGVHFDPRYLSISSEFFDDSESYVKDEGYKAY